MICMRLGPEKWQIRIFQNDILIPVSDSKAIKEAPTTFSSIELSKTFHLACQNKKAAL